MTSEARRAEIIITPGATRGIDAHQHKREPRRGETGMAKLRYLIVSPLRGFGSIAMLLSPDFIGGYYCIAPSELFAWQ
jgi:hypothetical protein